MASGKDKAIQNEFIKSIKKNVSSYAMVIALIAIWILFSITTNGIFISFRNISMLFRQVTPVGILAIGMAFCIISGNFDLAVGSVMGFTGVVAALAQLELQLSAGGAIVVAILIGLLIGAWQGFWIAVQRIPAFIVTLGGMMIFRGLTVWASGGKGISLQSEWLKKVAMEYLPPTWGWIFAAGIAIGVILLSINNRKQRQLYGLYVNSFKFEIVKLFIIIALIMLFAYSMNAYRGVPLPVLLLFFIFMFFNFILKNTIFGRHVYAIGGNPNAAKLSGISVRRTTFIIFIFTSTLAAVAGVVLVSRIGTATPDAGQSYEMYAIASCVIGGISLVGGRGKIFGALIGSLVIASLNNGMSLMNLAQSVQNVVTGLILIVAVWFDTINSRRVEK